MSGAKTEPTCTKGQAAKPCSDTKTTACQFSSPLRLTKSPFLHKSESQDEPTRDQSSAKNIACKSFVAAMQCNLLARVNGGQRICPKMRRMSPLGKVGRAWRESNIALGKRAKPTDEAASGVASISGLSTAASTSSSCGLCHTRQAANLWFEEHRSIFRSKSDRKMPNKSAGTSSKLCS